MLLLKNNSSKPEISSGSITEQPAVIASEKGQNKTHKQNNPAYRNTHTLSSVRSTPVVKRLFLIHLLMVKSSIAKTTGTEKPVGYPGRKTRISPQPKLLKKVEAVTDIPVVPVIEEGKVAADEEKTKAPVVLAEPETKKDVTMRPGDSVRKTEAIVKEKPGCRLLCG